MEVNTERLKELRRRRVLSRRELEERVAGRVRIELKDLTHGGSTGIA